MLPAHLIRKKRDGERLTDAEIDVFVDGAANGSIPDYQVAAMLMAIFLRGLDAEELARWAHAMIHSGDVLDLSSIDRAKVDKHSTGGVGDKISLPLAPAVAACGVAVPMVSGRGLGHTGGTLDKLESIPGFRVDLGIDHFTEQVRTLGTCLIGQTDRLAPADRILYALRDVTATIESIPLIASSIMSKKCAEGIDALVLDCKVGNGAFMKTREQARELGEAIRIIGNAAGVQVCVMLTAMDAPIGVAVGNSIEVAESIDILRGAGPADTRELTVRLGAEMLRMGGVATDDADGAKRIARALDDGSALEVFRRVVEAQGGDPNVVDDPEGVLPRAAHTLEVRADRSGYVTAIAADGVGVAALVLGAGRRAKEDHVDPSVGIEIAARVCAKVNAGDVLAVLLHNDLGVDQARALTQNAFTIGDAAPQEAGRVLEVLR